MESLTNQICPTCFKKKLKLTETIEDISDFGKIYLFSMDCSNCNLKKSDVEVEENKGPTSYSLMIESKKDLNLKVIKSSSAKIRFPSLR